MNTKARFKLMTATTLGIASFATVNDKAYAGPQSLSESALFQRCYIQITSKRVSTTNSLYLDVKNGRKTAVDACLSVLDLAKFTANANQTIADQNNVEAKSVLQTFHRLHSSWFASKDFPLIDLEGRNRDNKNIYDSSTPALFFTRALFRPATQVKSVVTENINLRAYRTNMNPLTGPDSGHAKTDYIFENPVAFAPTGELVGVETASSFIVNYPAIRLPKPGIPAGSIDLNSTLGGGFLGTNAYLLLNTTAMDADEEYKTDGGIKVHRRWGKAIFQDALCREIPVVREADVTSYVDLASPVSFRNSAACTKCHASQDRAAGVIRGYKLFGLGKGGQTIYGQVARGGEFPAFHRVTQAAEQGWPSKPDVDYFQRPTNGVFHLRSFDGTLIERSIASVPDLGQKIAETDDYYVCVAKRYYSYFTGININNGDLDDPYRTTKLTAGDLAHRKTVITLGTNLKTHQSLRELISSILRLSEYRKTDFGFSGE